MGLGYDMNITHFKYTIRHIMQQIVEIPNEKGSGYTAFQLFKRAKIEKNEQNEWYVEFDAHDDALPLMFDFKNRYFKYELWNALRLKSTNQVRMYEILKQYEGVGKRELTVKEIRELLGISAKEYDRWERFRVRVLDSCQQALKETTDICYTYERGRVGKGGKWLSIIFYIEKNENYVDKLTLEEFITQQPKPEPLALNVQSEDGTNQLSFTDIQKNLDNTANIEAEFVDGTDIISQLYKVCNYEFTREEIQSAYQFAKTFIHDKAVKVYFEQTYLKLLEIEKKRKIRDRFSYFYRIICSDAERQRKERQEMDQIAGYPPSYDIAEYESTSVLDEDWDD
jgi:plasmid replication initiation protein